MVAYNLTHRREKTKYNKILLFNTPKAVHRNNTEL